MFHSKTDIQDSEKHIFARIARRQSRLHYGYPNRHQSDNYSCLQYGRYLFVGLFVRDELTIRFGAQFLRVLCLAIPIYTITFVIIALFQTVGKGVAPFVLAVLHKGAIDIILMFIINSMFGSENLVWAAPASEIIALTVGICMTVIFIRRQNERM